MASMKKKRLFHKNGESARKMPAGEGGAVPGIVFFVQKSKTRAEGNCC